MEIQTKVRNRGFEVIRDFLTTEVLMPVRKTKYSAGYDFLAPYDFTLNPNETHIVSTGIKAYMQTDEYLMIVPRSSLAMKKDTILKNITGIIDHDYYNNEKNEGLVMISLKNIGKETQYFSKGEGLVQGIFTKYLTADNCNTDEARTGGVGSTNK